MRRIAIRAAMLFDGTGLVRDPCLGAFRRCRRSGACSGRCAPASSR
jgi:hypothetical protein